MLRSYCVEVAAKLLNDLAVGKTHGHNWTPMSSMINLWVNQNNMLSILVVTKTLSHRTTGGVARQWLTTMMPPATIT
jgi:hypothetical protein